MKMNRSKETSFADRQSAAAAAKKAALERHRDAAYDPGLAGRQAARQAVKIARDSRVAERNAPRVASKTREAAEKAAEEAAREAAFQAEHAARQAEAEAKASSDLAGGAVTLSFFGADNRPQLFGAVGGTGAMSSPMPICCAARLARLNCFRVCFEFVRESHERSLCGIILAGDGISQSPALCGFFDEVRRGFHAPHPRRGQPSGERRYRRNVASRK